MCLEEFKHLQQIATAQPVKKKEFADFKSQDLVPFAQSSALYGRGNYLQGVSPKKGAKVSKH